MPKILYNICLCNIGKCNIHVGALIMQNCSSVMIFFKYLSVQVNVKKNIHINS